MNLLVPADNLAGWRLNVQRGTRPFPGKRAYPWRIEARKADGNWHDVSVPWAQDPQ